MRILILGVTGMLGNAVFRVLSEDTTLTVWGSARSDAAKCYFKENLRQQIVVGVDVEHHDSLVRVFGKVRPDVVINCIGLVKQVVDVEDPLQAIPINTLLPHRLAALCKIAGARLVHISTDCVFSGAKGNYLETDFPDANDLYGRSKLLGEVDNSYTVTLRTSIVGHELSGHRSLVGWFLAQKGSVRGFTNVIFSGLPTVELARVIRDLVLPSDMCGLYHVAAKPINKFDLLKLIANAYEKSIEIIPDEKLIIDRSLNADRFNSAAGYVTPEWPDLIKQMYLFDKLKVSN